MSKNGVMRCLRLWRDFLPIGNLIYTGCGSKRFESAQYLENTGDKACAGRRCRGILCSWPCHDSALKYSVL